MCYLIKRSNCTVDVHWRPYFKRCQYCQIDYDVIGKQESFKEDVKYIFIKSGLDKIIPFTLDETLNAVQRDYSKVNHYFDQVDQKKLKLLYEAYQIDFEMFGYNLEQINLNINYIKIIYISKICKQISFVKRGIWTQFFLFF